MPNFHEILFQKMHGRLVGEDVPYYQPMLDTAHRMMGSILSLGPTIVSAVKKEAKQAGVPPSYIWWLMDANKDEWPPMVVQQKSALEIALAVARKSGSTPNYTQTFETPSEDTEDDADLVVFDVAAWCYRTLMKAIHRAIFEACKQFAPKIEKAYQELNTVQATGVLAKLVIHHAKNHPGVMNHPSLLVKIFSLLKLS